MSRWLIRIGALLFALGIFLLSPLADMLPADMPGNAGQSNASAYATIILNQSPGFDFNAAICLAGLVLLLSGLIARRRGK